MTSGNPSGQSGLPARVRKVLIVDDSDDCRHLLEVFLSRAGNFSFVEASSARQAIEKLENEVFHLVISDYFMGNDTGLDVALYLEGAGRPAPPFFIFTSGPDYLSKSVRERYRVFNKADIVPLIEAVRALESA